MGPDGDEGTRFMTHGEPMGLGFDERRARRRRRMANLRKATLLIGGLSAAAIMYLTIAAIFSL